MRTFKSKHQGVKRQIQILSSTDTIEKGDMCYTTLISKKSSDLSISDIQSYFVTGNLVESACIGEQVSLHEDLSIAGNSDKTLSRLYFRILPFGYDLTVFRKYAKSKKDELNSLAYLDCLDRKEPRFPECSTYMDCYRSWAPLAFTDQFDERD